MESVFLMIVNWAGKIKPETVCETPVTSVDFFPTFLEFVGGNPKDYKELEGMSLFPLLQNSKKGFDRSLYWHFPHHIKEGLSMGAAIRNGKYIIEFETEKEYLYNLEKDISEAVNLFEENPEKTKKLAADLKEW